MVVLLYFLLSLPVRFHYSNLLFRLSIIIYNKLICWPKERFVYHRTVLSLGQMVVQLIMIILSLTALTLC